MPTPLLGLQVRFFLPWVFVSAAALAQSDQPAPTTLGVPDPAIVRADILAERSLLQAGQPVWVILSLTNLTGEPVTLKAPEMSAGLPTDVEEASPPEMGLPLAHVFSGLRSSAISVKDERGTEWDGQVSARPRGLAPVVRLAAHASVGLRMNLTQYYSSLKHPGKYTLVWRPYDGALVSAPLTLTILAERQAIIRTEFGDMTVRFYFDEAPNTVQNFVELVEKRFYDHLTFHKIVAHALIQGGDPRGDGKGARPDGKRVKAEFSKIPFVAGTVGMARQPKDPDSASCQFFITASRQAALDGNQTAFGYLVGPESLRTLEKIAAVPTDEQGRPRQPVVIRGISLQTVPSRDPDVTGGASRGPTTRPAIISAPAGEPSGSGGVSPGGTSPEAVTPEVVSVEVVSPGSNGEAATSRPADDSRE